MLLMSTGFVAAAFFAVTTWLEGSAHPMLEKNHPALFMTLILTQGIILAIGAVLSLFFARRVLRPIRRAHQAQADFAANAHHQLRTPIAIMQAEIDTALVRPGQKLEDYRRVLDSIGDELRLLRTTSEQLLVQAEGAPVKVKAINLSQAAETALQQLQPRYNLEISRAITPDIQSTFSTEELIILFEILLDNTQKHVGKVVKDIKVKVTLTTTDSKIRLIYTDNGQGVTAGDEKQLFKREFRGRNTKTDGNGLGLAIAADLVALHKGTISAHNLPAGGLAFVISLPSA